MNIDNLNKANSVIAAHKKIAQEAIKLEAVLAEFDRVAGDNGFKDFASVLAKLEALADSTADMPQEVVEVENAPKPERKKRGRMDDEKRAAIVTMLKETDASGSSVHTLKEIAEKFELSIGTVSSIKKAEGLTSPKAKK